MDIGTYIRDVINKAQGKEPTIDYTDTIEQLTAITNKNTLPQKPDLEVGEKYERLDYSAPTKEQIEQSAVANLSEYKQAGEKSIENEISALLEKYSAQKTGNDESYEKMLKSLSDAYEMAMESASNDALKRGLARSSIAVNTVSAIEGEHAKEKSALMREHEQKLREIDDEIAMLEVKKQKALDDFNVAYTARLTEQIDKLKAESAQKQAEVVKYNNSLTEKEREEEIKREKAESELYTQALEQKKAEDKMKSKLTEQEQDAQYQEVYGVLRDKLLTLSPTQAQREVISNPIYRTYLSDAYYYKLYNEFAR